MILDESYSPGNDGPESVHLRTRTRVKRQTAFKRHRKKYKMIVKAGFSKNVCIWVEAKKSCPNS